ncbi:MAG: hypothetical protein ACRCTU_03685 [Zoogloea sp.]|uniref:hypothetical protein n=1 Tax=Zoogloea sp. TaxID=49181 RepID=UPI003F31A5BA
MIRYLRVLIWLAALVGLLGALPARALDATYEGVLIPNSFDNAIPITVEIHTQTDAITGKVSTGAPITASAPIGQGSFVGGVCLVRSILNASFSIRLQGNCSPQAFEGEYSIYLVEYKTKVGGKFRLMSKVSRAKPEDERKKSEALKPQEPETTLTQCINSNARCLAGCPQGDYNSEFLCANRCRSKFQACKAKTQPGGAPGGLPPLPSATPSADPLR